MQFIEQILESPAAAKPTTINRDDSSDFDLTALREKGTWNCGYKNISEHEKIDDEFFVQTLDDDDDNDNTTAKQTADPIHPPITKQRLVEVFLQRTERKV